MQQEALFGWEQPANTDNSGVEEAPGAEAPLGRPSKKTHDGRRRDWHERALLRAQRISLGASAPGRKSWVERTPLFTSECSGLFERILNGVAWQVHEREMFDRIVKVPRLVGGLPTAEGEDGFFNWEGQAVATQSSTCARADRLELRTELLTMGDVLSRHYGKSMRSISFAYYRDGNDSVAFHGDKLGRLRKDTVVAILSLGGLRRFLLRPSPNHSCGEREPFGFTLSTGDLTVMGGAAQLDWEHAIPKQKHAEPRIAVMFRESTGAPGKLGERNAPR